MEAAGDELALLLLARRERTARENAERTQVAREMAIEMDVGVRPNPQLVAMLGGDPGGGGDIEMEGGDAQGAEDMMED